MTAKEFLKQYEYATHRAERLRMEYEKEHELIGSVRSTLGGDGMPHGSGVSKSVEDQAIRLADKAMEWKVAELEAIRIRQRVFEVIESIPGVEGAVLFERYINLSTWEQIAEKLYYSSSGIFYAHIRALEMVEEKLKSDGKQDI